MKVNYEDVKTGDSVEFLAYAGMGRNGAEWKPKKGKMVMRGPAGLVLNTGGAHGTPAVVSQDKFLSATRRKEAP